MKRTMYLIIVSLLCAGMLLSACTSTRSGNQALPSQTAGGAQGSGAMQLALGMFKLDSSAYPVDAQQAATLLPLWKAARTLGKSDSTADEEIAGLIKQIQSSLTAQQLQVIQGMTAEDMQQVAQAQGVMMGPAGAPPAGAMPTERAGTGGMGGPGGMMMGGGGPPPGMGGPGGGGSSSQTTGKTATESGSFQGVSMAVLDAIIKSLQSKIQ